MHTFVLHITCQTETDVLYDILLVCYGTCMSIQGRDGTPCGGMVPYYCVEGMVPYYCVESRLTGEIIFRIIFWSRFSLPLQPKGNDDARPTAE